MQLKYIASFTDQKGFRGFERSKKNYRYFARPKNGMLQLTGLKMVFAVFCSENIVHD